MEKKDVVKETNKDNKSKNIILVLVALLVIACIAIVLLIVKPWSKNDNNTNTTTTTTETTTTTAAEETVTLRFDSNGGTPVEDMVVKKGEKVTLPKTTREGYEFNCWLDENDDCPNDVQAFDTDKNYVANWEPIEKNPKKMKVTFDSRGGSSVKTQTYTCKLGGITFYTPDKPTKDFYEFRVWEDKNGTPILNGALLTCEDITLYAVWDYDGPEANPEQNN
jgi:hypothetical protein